MAFILESIEPRRLLSGTIDDPTDAPPLDPLPPIDGGNGDTGDGDAGDGSTPPDEGDTSVGDPAFDPTSPDYDPNVIFYTFGGGVTPIDWVKRTVTDDASSDPVDATDDGTFDPAVCYAGPDILPTDTLVDAAPSDEMPVFKDPMDDTMDVPAVDSVPDGAVDFAPVPENDTVTPPDAETFDAPATAPTVKVVLVKPAVRFSDVPVAKASVSTFVPLKIKSEELDILV